MCYFYDDYFILFSIIRSFGIRADFAIGKWTFAPFTFYLPFWPNKSSTQPTNQLQSPLFCATIHNNIAILCLYIRVSYIVVVQANTSLEWSKTFGVNVLVLAALHNSTSLDFAFFPSFLLIFFFFFVFSFYHRAQCLCVFFFLCWVSDLLTFVFE